MRIEVSGQIQRKSVTITECSNTNLLPEIKLSAIKDSYLSYWHYFTTNHGNSKSNINITDIGKQRKWTFSEIKLGKKISIFRLLVMKYYKINFSLHATSFYTDTIRKISKFNFNRRSYVRLYIIYLKQGWGYFVKSMNKLSNSFQTIQISFHHSYWY